MLEQRIEQHFIDSADLKYQSAQVLSKPIAAAVQALMVCVTSGGKVLACGNGGSATVAQGFAAGFVGGFERDRPELAAIALATDSATLTAIANGHAFSSVFSRQVRALGWAPATCCWRFLPMAIAPICWTRSRPPMNARWW